MMVVKRVAIGMVVSMALGLGACAPMSHVSGSPSRRILSKQSQQVLELVKLKKAKIKGDARIALLFDTNNPASLSSIKRWLRGNNATITFISTKFGYMDAKMTWANLERAVKSIPVSSNLIDSLFKLEIDDANVVGVSKPEASWPSSSQVQSKSQTPAPEPGNSDYIGRVHSAGFGTHLNAFKNGAARLLQMDPQAINGSGVTVAVFDGSLNLRYFPIFGNRVKDFIVTSHRMWKKANLTYSEWAKKYKFSKVPAGISDLLKNSTLRFAVEQKSSLDDDYNLDSNNKDLIHIAVYKSGNAYVARVMVDRDLGFGKPISDYQMARENQTPELFSLGSGQPITTANVDRESGEFPCAIKIETDKKGGVKIALVGGESAGDHGTSNMQMVGGVYSTANPDISYSGVAPGVGLYSVVPWSPNRYDRSWIGLARGIIVAANRGANILDLDIGAPDSSHTGGDLLSKLLCRVVKKTSVIPVIAAHNYGPLPTSIQNLAQSPCVLTVGASNTKAEMIDGEGVFGSQISPLLQSPQSQYTALFSGRGFTRKTGQLKPDIIAPDYALTAYETNLIRFGGTSGATPTTSGSIALILQVAKKAGLNMDFGQMKSLLQGSSDPLLPGESVRDGYGYLDMANVWTHLKRELGKGTQPASLVLTALGPTKIVGPTNALNVGYKVARVQTFDQFNAPEKMKVWIEASSVINTPGEVGLLDPDSGQAMQQIELDVPPIGNGSTFRLHVHITPAQWDALPIGETTLLIKGVRANLYHPGTRFFDFVKPIVLIKSVKQNAAQLYTGKLYFYQVKRFPISSFNGEHLEIGVNAICPSTGRVAQTEVYVDPNGARYPDAFLNVNSYQPLSATDGPFEIRSKSKIVYVAVGNYGADSCPGPIQALVRVTRLDIQPSVTSLQYFTQGQSEIIKGHVNLTAKNLDISYFADKSFNLEIQPDQSYLLLKFRPKGNFAFRAPVDLKFIRVLPLDNVDSAPMITAVDGKEVVEANSWGEAQSLPGFATSFASFNPVEAEMDSVKAGTPVLISSPFNLNHDIIEIGIAPPNSISEKLKGGGFSSLNKVRTFALSVTNSLKPYAEFPSNDWSYQLNLKLALKDQLVRSSFDPDIQREAPIIWTTQLKLPLSLKQR